MTLVKFLEARIAEDEGVARAAGSPIRSRGNYGDPRTQAPVDSITVTWRRSERRSIPSDHGEHVEGTALHLRFNPSRVLAECVAKRKIIEAHTTGGDTSSDPNMDAACTGMHDTFAARAEDCDTLRALAAVYADHPDYDAGWAFA